MARCLFSRNPLVRLTDRVEAALLGLVVLLALALVPIAAALGTEVYADGVTEARTAAGGTGGAAGETGQSWADTTSEAMAASTPAAVGVSLAIVLLSLGGMLLVALVIGCRLAFDRHRSRNWERAWAETAADWSGRYR